VKENKIKDPICFSGTSHCFDYIILHIGLASLLINKLEVMEKLHAEKCAKRSKHSVKIIPKPSQGSGPYFIVPMQNEVS